MLRSHATHAPLDEGFKPQSETQLLVRKLRDQKKTMLNPFAENNLQSSLFQLKELWSGGIGLYLRLISSHLD
jgi:hypothetical protein